MSELVIYVPAEGLTAVLLIDFCFCLQDSMPLSTLVMGDPSNTAPNSLAQRLGNDA